MQTSAAAADSLLAAGGVDRALLGSPAVVPGVGPDVATVVAAERRAQATVAAAEVRQQHAGELHELAVTAQRASEKADAADERAAESEGFVEAERRALHDRRSACHAAEADWAAAMREWTRSASPPTRAPTGPRSTPGSTTGATTSVGPRRSAPQSTTPSPHPSRPPGSPRRELPRPSPQRGRRCRGQARVADVEASTEARPEPSRFRGAERDAAAGAPFYELVDVGDALGADDAAGLEAALEASGILDAWVSADGVAVHPRTNDVIVTAGGAADDGAPSLAGMLRPAIPADSPVSAASVAALLAAIGWGEQAQRSTWVANDGRWQTGLLHGAWSKTAIEFLGAGARRETRRRQLERARAELATRREELASALAAAAKAEIHRDLIEALPARAEPMP